MRQIDKKDESQKINVMWKEDSVGKLKHKNKILQQIS